MTSEVEDFSIKTRNEWASEIEEFKLRATNSGSAPVNELMREVQRIDQALQPHYAWANRLALFYGDRYRAPSS